MGTEPQVYNDDADEWYVLVDLATNTQSLDGYTDVF